MAFDAAWLLATQPAVVEVALWFRGAVYEPRSNTNEEASAALAVAVLTEVKLPASLIPTLLELFGTPR